MKSKRWVWVLAQGVVFVAVLYGIYTLLAPELRSLTWAELSRWRPSFARLALSLLMLVGMYVTHAFLWRRIAADLGVGRLDARNAVRIYSLAGLGRYIPGKLWQVAGLAVLSSRAGLSAGGATAAALLGQVGFLATGLIFVAVVLPDWISGTTLYILGFVLVSAAGAIWLLTATPAGHRGREWIRSRLGERGSARFNAALDLADHMRGRDAIAWGVGYGLSWILLGLAFTTFVTAFVPEADAQNHMIAGTVAASYLAGYLVIVAPAGLGVRELTMTTLLSAIPGFPVAAAVVVSVLSRVWFTLGEVLPLAILPLFPTSKEPAATPAADSEAR